ncbi:hypothetical protein GGH94_004593, partial [Coemansia aciculifera]
TNESRVPKEVVTESNKVRDLVHLFELANDKYAILFYHNPTKPKPEKLCTHKVPQSSSKKAPYRVWKRKVAPAVNGNLTAIKEADEPADVIQETVEPAVVETDEPTASKETDESADAKPQENPNLQTSTKEEPPSTPEPVLNSVPEDTPEH